MRLGGGAWMPDSNGQNGTSDRLTGADAAELSSQIASLARSGLPLAQGLAALGAELPRGGLRRSIKDLATALEAGMPLDQAVKTRDDNLPPHLRGLLVAGLRSGELGNLLDRFYEYLSIGVDLKRRLWLSLAYPALVLGAVFALLSGVCVFLVKQFEALYNDFGIPLPTMTRVLFVVAHLFSAAMVPLCIFAGLIFCAWLASRVFLPRAERRSMACRLPLLGPVWRSMSLAEFCHLLALLVDGRLPMSEAIRLTGQGIEDSSIDQDCRVMAGRVESGESLSRAMASRSRFPIGLARLLRWAENQKSVSEVLHMAGSMFEARARAQSKFVGVVLNFLCVLMVFGMVLAVPALFTPLLVLITKLSG
jgi:type II secretory pathway component PulF